MTTDIERQFFETFRIEPKKQCFNEDCIVKDETGYDEKICNDKCVYIDKEYPQITDRILLELICIVLNAYEKLEVYTECTVEKLKEKTLKQLILAQDDVYSQVRTLFKEGDNNDR